MITHNVIQFDLESTREKCGCFFYLYLYFIYDLLLIHIRPSLSHIVLAADASIEADSGVASILAKLISISRRLRARIRVSEEY